MTSTSDLWEELQVQIWSFLYWMQTESKLQADTEYDVPEQQQTGFILLETKIKFRQTEDSKYSDLPQCFKEDFLNNLKFGKMSK